MTYIFKHEEAMEEKAKRAADIAEPKGPKFNSKNWVAVRNAYILGWKDSLKFKQEQVVLNISEGP